MTQSPLMDFLNALNPLRILFSPISRLGRFFLLLMAFPLTAFFFLYAIMGLVLEGDSLARWQWEAMNVGQNIMLLVLGYQAYVAFLAICKKVPFNDYLYRWMAFHIALGAINLGIIAAHV